MKNYETIYGIEILRFISALAILIYHYQHFYFFEDQEFVIENQPFYIFLKFFYIYGFQGVNFFWCISGFIFFWKYSEIIKDMNSFQFFKIRFARLYPLHLLTLIFVIILQYFYLLETDQFFLDLKNDLYHFFLQIFMASYWGFEVGHSFNSPIWSISIEILVYIFFYILLKNFGASSLINFIIIVICISLKAIYEYNAHVFFDCSLFFFLGGIIALNIKHIKNLKLVNFLIFLTVLLALFFTFKFDLYLLNNFTYCFQLLLYPLLLIFFFNLKFNNINLNNLLSVFGNLTYSSYLLHLPIQILIGLIFIKLGETVPTNEKIFFIFYILFVLTISYFSFRYFENPVRKYLRKGF